MSANDHLNGVQFDSYVSKRGGGSISAMHEGKEIGYLSWNNRNQVDDVYTNKGWRGQGVATSLWNEAHKMGHQLSHNEERTDAGNGWAQHVGGHLPPRMVVKYPGED